MIVMNKYARIKLLLVTECIFCYPKASGKIQFTVTWWSRPD